MWLTSLFGLLFVLALPQGEATVPAPTPITAKEIQQALEGLHGDEATVQEQREFYERAASFLAQAEELRNQAEQFQNDAKAVPGRKEALEAQRAVLPNEGASEDFSGLTLAELESRLAQAQADLKQLRDEKALWKSRSDGRPARIQALPEEIAKTKQDAINNQDAQVALSLEARAGAQGIQWQAQAQAIQARLDALEAELHFQEAQRDLDPLLADRYQRQERQLETTVATLQGLVADRRSAEADATAAAATRRAQEIQQREPKLASLAADIERLAAMRTGSGGLPQRITNAERSLKSSEAKLIEIRSRFESTSKRMRVAGLTESMGRILSKEFEWLENPRELHRRGIERREVLSQCELQLLDMKEEREKSGDPNLAYQSILATLGVENPNDDIAQICLKLVNHQRELQDQVIEDLKTLSSSLTRLQSIQNDIETSSNTYRSYIESRILWVRSAGNALTGGMNSLPAQSWAWSMAWIQWSSWSYLVPAILNNSGTTVFVGLMLLILLAGRPFLVRKREEMTKAVRSRRSDRFLLTVRALVQTLLLTMWGPLLLWYAGIILSHSALLAESARVAEVESNANYGSILGQGMGSALADYAAILWVLSFLYHLVWEKGVGEVHFRWNPQTTALVRRHLRWFVPIVVVSGLVSQSLNAQDLVAPSGTLDVAGQSETVGRLAFCIVMLSLAVFLRAMGQKDSPLWTLTLQRKPGIMIRVHSLWTSAAVLIPLALLVMALLGFYYTALKLQGNLMWSLAMGLGLVLVHSLLLRWLNITRWRLAVSQAREKAKLRAQAQAEAAAENAESTIQIAFDEAAVDLPALDTQTRQLFRSGVTLSAILGLYFIWASALPALKGLDNVQLWPELRILSSEQQIDPSWNMGTSTAAGSTEVPTAPAGSAPAPTQAPSEVDLMPSSPMAMATPHATADNQGGNGLPSSLTLGDVILAILILLLMGAAARNLPGLLEISLLQRLPLDSGSRYAVATLVRYLIFIIGISAASSTLGLGWDRIQWLVAALTFGLAFGLQEIFANFVSGLIILLERPIRVGDVVTVGTTEGVVTRLRMRATTVQDWDRRELLVPNKEFITTSVINWTLTDPITRLILKVGVAYGSDIDKTRSLLLKIAKNNPHVVDAPSPSVVFRQFGDSTLDFELRVFIASRDNWPAAVDTINSAIDKNFRENAIEIAFPQRDLHIRSGLEFLGHQTQPNPVAPPS
ncbi:MAG: mechanosensitive ion channel [Planctomycetes bacterium]|nr:mechanosensitive ion channel [Planctomycetota bacterium]HPF13083.1 mechanosensitive ion channel [Planctomycetota bacterium]HRV80098.1 mechanosensitive ion channel [Planctomycetota bacterium]